MYDNELETYLQKNNHNISHEQYLYICQTCTQIRHIEYKPYGDYFELVSDNNQHFSFKVYY